MTQPRNKSPLNNDLRVPQWPKICFITSSPWKHWFFLKSINNLSLIKYSHTIQCTEKNMWKQNQDHAFHTQQKWYYSLSKVFPWLLLFLRVIMNSSSSGLIPTEVSIWKIHSSSEVICNSTHNFHGQSPTYFVRK